MNRPALQPSLKGRALRLLSQREHSRLELERKLAGHETEPGQLAKALDELQARGFISEERVVESVVHRRASKLGTARVRQELQAKGLSPQVMAEALEQLRALEAGHRIAVALAPEPFPAGVDTPEDLARAERRLAASRVRG